MSPRPINEIVFQNSAIILTKRATDPDIRVLKMSSAFKEKGKKVKVRFLYSAAYTVEPEQRASQSQEVAVDWWCCGAMRSIHCPR